MFDLETHLRRSLIQAKLPDIYKGDFNEYGVSIQYGEPVRMCQAHP